MKEDWEEPYFTEEATAYGKRALVWFLATTAFWMVVIGGGWGLAHIY